MHPYLTNKVSRAITTLALVILISAIAFAPKAKATPLELVINYTGNLDGVYNSLFNYNIVKSPTNQWKKQDIDQKYTNLLYCSWTLTQGINRLTLGDFDISNTYLFGSLEIQKSHETGFGALVENGFKEPGLIPIYGAPWIELKSTTDWDTGISGKLDIIMGLPVNDVGTWTLKALPTSTPTPEPSSIILLSLGLGAIAYTVRKRRRR